MDLESFRYLLLNTKYIVPKKNVRLLLIHQIDDYYDSTFDDSLVWAIEEGGEYPKFEMFYVNELREAYSKGEVLLFSKLPKNWKLLYG